MTSQMLYPLGHVPPEYQTSSTIIWTLTDDLPGQYGSSSRRLKRKSENVWSCHMTGTFYQRDVLSRSESTQTHHFCPISGFKAHNVEFVVLFFTVIVNNLTAQNLNICVFVLLYFLTLFFILTWTSVRSLSSCLVLSSFSEMIP